MLEHENESMAIKAFKRNHLKKLSFGVIIICTCIYFIEHFILLKQNEVQYLKSIRIGASATNQTVSKKEDKQYILYWRNDWGVDSGFFDGNWGDCVVTHNRSRLEDAKAVVFHYTALDHETMPWKHYRDQSQVFVFFTMESPPYIANYERRTNFEKFDEGFINSTMSYRTDSDVFFLYEKGKGIFSQLQKANMHLEETLSLKKRVAIWVVSNCDIIWGSIARMRYVQALVDAGLEIDRYGACFNNSSEYKKLSKKQMNSYKFYLSFENALHCKDYVTEKFWSHAILRQRVPVVWGPSREDMKNLAPAGSYIHTEDFDSPAEVASYLMYLHKNDSAYREYFRWRNESEGKFPSIKEKTKEEELCQQLKDNKKKKVINSITDFMYKHESKECLRKKKLKTLRQSSLPLKNSTKMGYKTRQTKLVTDHKVLTENEEN